MKQKVLSIFIILAVIFVSIPPTNVIAGAYDTSFTTSITYQNVGDAATNNLQVHFYPNKDSTSPIIIDRPNLAAGAGTSLFIGAVGDLDAGFRGSAVMLSDQPLLATLVQLPQASTTVRNRPLSNGFSEGGSQSLIATVLKNQFDTNSIFSVQNIGGASTTITIQFYNTNAVLVHQISGVTIAHGAAYFVDAGQVPELGTSFNGSAVVEASSGSIVSTVMELAITGISASAFEGVAQGSTIFYMPSALCDAFGARTAYAVQNTSLTQSTSVTVEYSNGVTHTQNIGPGAKQSFIACDAPGMTAGFNGSATVTSATTPVIAIGKAYGSGLSTAFVGASSGTSKLALPYVRWASNTNYANGTQQRTFLTIQNIGGTAISAGAVRVDYIDKNGVVLGTHTLGAIPAGGKLNSNASDAGLSEFGVYPDGSFGGGAIVTGPTGSQLAVVGRVSTQVAPGQFASEDYNGMPVP
jgi:hypothetical protein